MRAAFCPARPTYRADLRFAGGIEPPWPVRLRSGAWQADGRVRVEVVGALSSGLSLATDEVRTPLGDDGVTFDVVDPGRSRLAWLVDPARGQVSNKVAIDEPAALRAALLDRGDGGDERPAGFDAADLDTPVGQMLARLHAACVFDFDDTRTARRVGRLMDDDVDPEFWDRLAREDLQSDPRVARYRQLQGRLTLLDELFLDIARMRDAVPPLLNPVGVQPGADAAIPAHPAPRWTPDRRLQVRLFNLLERWCAALSDPRLLWISPAAPIANFVALVDVLRQCWLEGYLPEPRVTRLVGVLLGSMLATERRPGFLATLETSAAADSATALGESQAPEILAGLLWGCLRPGRRDLLTYLFDWQPALRVCRELGAVRASGIAAQLAAELTAGTTTLKSIDERLSWAATYINDAQWCHVVSRDLRLGRVVFVTAKVAPHFGAVLQVPSTVGLISNHKVVELVRRALEYRRTEGVIVQAGEDKLVIRLDEIPVVVLQGHTVEGTEPLIAADLDVLSASGGSFGLLMGRFALEAAG